MKKKLLLICMLAAAMLLGGSGAWAYNYTQYLPAPNGSPNAGYTNQNPSDEVEAYLGSSVTSWSQTNFIGPNWGLQIGDSNFNIGGANVVTSGGTTYLNIFTGWSGPTYSEYGAVAADLTLYSNGKAWMVRLDQNGEGTLFTNPTSYYTSYGLFQAKINPPTYGGNNYGSLIYGAYWNFNNPQLIPVWCTAATSTSTPAGLVTWSSGTPYWEVSVDLSAITGLNSKNFFFLYSSGTCANGVLTGDVPICSTLLLLGTGLVGLAGLRWKWSLKT